jgi:N-acetylglucosamine kinase-like BadF-type ATPase
MILIADSGSTKTQWCMISDNKLIHTCITPGINPFYQNQLQITESIKNNFNGSPITFEAIYFYGAGCPNEEKQNQVKNALADYFTAPHIFVGSDLLAAARSLCQAQPGIACILGTGSNSCYYNGADVEQNVSPLGFILGDEGSGAVIGKKFIGDLLKNQLSEELKELFFATYNTTAAELLDNVYKKPFPNRYLAQYTRFIATHIHHAQMDELVTTSFVEFLNRNVLQYKQANSLPIHFTGSIALHFKPQLLKALQSVGLSAGKIIGDPMEGIIQFHLNQKN